MIRDISYQEINFVSLENGICVDFNSNNLELFYNDITNDDIKIVDASTIVGSKLYTNGSTVFMSKGNKLYSIKLK